MRKLILGIVAVFCVQITFQAFTAFDISDADRKARLAEGPLVGPVFDGSAAEVAELPSKDELPAAVTTSSPRFPVVKRAVITDLVIRSATYHRPAPRTVNSTALVAMAERPATPDVFATQTISYPSYLSARESTRPEKRSFFAKALPVIKKPYDLLKAVGSKLK